ncbi:MAG: hydantoinase B/oxoprolinase family protein, partial [Nitratireductor sp.]
MTHEADRHEDVPWGVFGGKPGAGGRVEIRNVHTGEVSQEPAKFSGKLTRAGDVVSYFSPCGGGYGDPLERDPDKVLDDVLDGFITRKHARDDYGVVLEEVDDGYGWKLDLNETRKLRARMSAR